MKIVVAAFYADVVNRPSRFDEFLPLILASRRALSITNPDAKYLVLTDYSTSKLFDKHNIECLPISPEYMPLMSKIVFAQKSFMNKTDADLVILPDIDCIANRDLSDSISDSVGFATTHRGKKFDYRINNLAYIRDFGLGYWFLDRAYDILDQWPLAKRMWMGDQEAWQAALDPACFAHDSQWLAGGLPGITYAFENTGNDILVCRHDFPYREIHLYPCSTHNCFMNDAGVFKDNHRNAYMIHFKGKRKRHLGKWMKERFGDDNWLS